VDSTALDHVQTALREKEQEKRNRIASIDGSRGAGGVGRRPRVSKSVADGWDPTPPDYLHVSLMPWGSCGPNEGLAGEGGSGPDAQLDGKIYTYRRRV
jgi:hypothetical protein